ncbi:MAG: type II secretion system F family protein [Alphaproteobacteria bacterium]
MPSTRVEDFRLQDWLPYWLGADDLIAGLAALAMLVAAIAVWQALRGPNAFERRFAAIAATRQGLRQAALNTRSSRPRPTPATMMSAVVIRFNLLRSRHAQHARLLLARAGIRSNEAVVRYLFARLSMPFVFGLAVVADGAGPQLLPIPEHLRLLAALGGAVLGFYAPDTFLKNRVQKRSHQIELGLPDALDLLVICAEAGLSLDAALVRVSRELEMTWPELSEEFAITAAELTYLPDRGAAFENLNARTDMASIRGVVNTLLQTAKFGTPLAQSLRVLAAEFRDARMTRAEEKAAKLPAMLTVPMIVFILPTLFIVVLGPAILNILDTFSGRPQKKPTEVTKTVRPGRSPQPVATTVVVEYAPSKPVKTTEKLPPPEATLVPVRVSVRAGDLVTVDADARALRDGSRHRVALVPAGTLDDAAEALRDGVPIAPDRVRVSLPASSPGPNEVRLYYVPPAGSDPQVGARAAVVVTSGDG